MTADNWITLAGVLVAAIGLFLGQLSLRHKISEVHVLVNSNLTKVMEKLGVETERSEQLTTTLKDANVDVPPRIAP